MRAVFSVLGLLVVVLIVGLLAKKQLTSIPAPATPAATANGNPAAPTGTPQQQLQQFQKALQENMQAPRADPDDK
jgi:hypothetical protein